MELPFAGVHQLCAPMFARLDALPKPQRDALSVALGRSSEVVRTGSSSLSPCSACCPPWPRSSHCLCLVDDAQWLDEGFGSGAPFVARRLLAESVGSCAPFESQRAGASSRTCPVAARRAGGGGSPCATGKRRRPARRASATGSSPRPESPLALELPRSVSAAELAGGFQLLASGDLPAHIEDHYARRPVASAVAAADAAGYRGSGGGRDASLRAAERLGIEVSALAPAQDAQLLEIGARVRFRHPLVRSAVYQAASPGDRQGVHGALAIVSDPEADADRRAWHRALAAAGPDETWPPS